MTLDLVIRATFMLLASRKLGSWHQITLRARAHFHFLAAFFLYLEAYQWFSSKYPTKYLKYSYFKKSIPHFKGPDVMNRVSNGPAGKVPGPIKRH